LARNELS